LFVVPHQIGGDGEFRFQSLSRFLETGKLESARYSVVGPLLATPLWFLGKALGYTREVTVFYNVVLFVLALVLLSRELEDIASRATRRLVVILLVFASMFPNHVTTFYSEVFTSLAVTLGIFWLARDKTLGGWAAIVLGAVNTPASVIGVAAIAARMTWRTKRLAHLAAPIVVFLLTHVESWIVRGSFFHTGYEGDAGPKTALPYSGLPGFSYPFALGLMAIFLSFGKGLIFFAPGMFFPPAAGTSERLRWIHRTLLAFGAGLIVVYARWWAWYGGSFWGPRFFLVFSIPACIALATNLAEPRNERRAPWRTLLLAFVTLLSFWVGVNGIIFDQTGLRICTENGWELEAFCYYVPEMSVLWHPLVDFESASYPKTRVLAVFICIVWMLIGVWTARDLLASLGCSLRERAATIRTALTDLLRQR